MLSCNGENPKTQWHLATHPYPHMLHIVCCIQCWPTVKSFHCFVVFFSHYDNGNYKQNLWCWAQLFHSDVLVCNVYLWEKLWGLDFAIFIYKQRGEGQSATSMWYCSSGTSIFLVIVRYKKVTITCAVKMQCCCISVWRSISSKSSLLILAVKSLSAPPSFKPELTSLLIGHDH